jgi:hypothetical protein
MSQLRTFRRWRRRWRSQREWSVRDSLWREAGAAVRGQLYRDRGGDHRHTAYLAGTGRSGTSWISEVINSDNGFRIIHEPLRPDRLRVTSVFRPRHYLRPDDRDPRYTTAMAAIVDGRIRSVWTDKYNRKLLPKRRLVREVRGNLLVPWIHRRFPEMPMVLLLRHPCAVVTSQLKWEGEWPIFLERFLSEGDLVEDLLGPLVDKISAAETEFDKHMFAWCIENVVPLRLLDPGEIHVAFYERFCVDPASELDRLLSFLGQSVNDRALTRLRNPSNSSRKDSAVVRGEDLVRSWQRAVTKRQVRRALEILELFGLDAVYGEEPMPLVSGPEEAFRLS